ncbi:hypothetical protein V1511DRAFT_532829 [Dipodascopsis uninucleata]
MAINIKNYEKGIEEVRNGDIEIKILFESKDDLLSSSSKIVILDSSFNPPTVAHGGLALRAMRKLYTNSDCSIVFMLAVQNADKAFGPAALCHRVAMMELLGKSLRYTVDDVETTPEFALIVTKHARFVDKASAICEKFGPQLEQVYVVGYDTLIRLLDPKYYQTTVAEALSKFMATSKVICFARPGDNWGSVREQLKLVNDIKSGSLEPEVPSKWAARIFIYTVDDEVNELNGISSTTVRNAVKTKKWDIVKDQVPANVMEYIKSEHLYLE